MSPFESLESRRLLSAALAENPVAQPDLTSAIAGFTPAQIRQAYGFNQITLASGKTTVAATGQGQTIAIVDAYNDPNIVTDLHTFDLQFGLTDPTLTRVSQTGSNTKLPATNADWDREISLDVEWAHAIAPKANILLVETNDADMSNLIAGVNYARKDSGVSVVSLSWGASEFWDETDYDSTLTTPSGHTPVTFVAASGDDGSRNGVEYPAASPNVLSVGGTTLTIKNSTGTYNNETGWSDSGGGTSTYEPEPAYQSTVQASRSRTVPDVSLNANYDTGYAIYDSVSYDGKADWVLVGGTSAAAPQWAALVALADQGRALKSTAALNNASVLTAIYQAAKTSSGYNANFNDITTGETSPLAVAKQGYDEVTGLGTPKAKTLATTLVNSSVVTTVQPATVYSATALDFTPFATAATSDSVLTSLETSYAGLFGNSPVPLL